MKNEAIISLPIFVRTSRGIAWEIDWLESPNASERLSTGEPELTKDDANGNKTFERMVWTLVILSLLLTLIGATVVVQGAFQTGLPLVR